MFWKLCSQAQNNHSNRNQGAKDHPWRFVLCLNNAPTALAVKKPKFFDSCSIASRIFCFCKKVQIYGISEEPIHIRFLAKKFGLYSYLEASHF